MDSRFDEPMEEYVQPQIGDDRTVQVEFRGAGVTEVVHFLADRADINVYLDANLDRQVDVSFPRVTVDSAMHTLLARNGLRLMEDPPGMYWVDTDDGSKIGQASFFVQSIDAAEIEENLKALVSTESILVVDAGQNLVVVRGPRADIEIVRTYLDAADRLKRQVLIEVRILEVTLGENFEFGVSAAIHDGLIEGNVVNVMQALTTPDTSFDVMLASESGTADATIQAISRFAGVNLVSSPRVLALTGAMSTIEVIREVPYINVTNTTTTDPGLGTGQNIVEEVEFKEVGIVLQVTPTIQENGTVKIVIDQSFSEVAEFFNSIPVVDKRQITGEFLVRNRDTVVFGGLMQDRRSEIDKGIPGLMHLPLIGRAFRSDEDVISKREMLVFLTPRIVDYEEGRRLTRVLEREYRETLSTTGVNPVSTD